MDHEDPCAAANCLPGENLGQWRLRMWTRTHPYYEDASFARLREASVTVDLPQRMVHKFWSGARYLRVGLSGRNLVTITKYPGMDPEVSSYGSQAIGRGEDLFPYPASRSFWFNIDVGF